MADSFIQKTGSRKGQQYRVTRGKSGQAVRVYGSGETVAVPLRAKTLNPAKVGGVAVPLGSGVNTAAGPRKGQGYRSYFAKGREYHAYGPGEGTVAFKRKTSTKAQRDALVKRFQASMANKGGTS